LDGRFVCKVEGGVIQQTVHGMVGWRAGVNASMGFDESTSGVWTGTTKQDIQPLTWGCFA